ncbi:MAG: hypothetical protein G01um101438_63 [Parcubacteria group bacterium Gr01-1014_38]|nr:MAG: hypothetical protein G01um101438_63 [Parcubacteria group bacterium Gr01-1014_38]
MKHFPEALLEKESPQHQVVFAMYRNLKELVDFLDKDYQKQSRALSHEFRGHILQISSFGAVTIGATAALGQNLLASDSLARIALFLLSCSVVWGLFHVLHSTERSAIIQEQQYLRIRSRIEQLVREHEKYLLNPNPSQEDFQQVSRATEEELVENKKEMTGGRLVPDPTARQIFALFALGIGVLLAAVLF